MALHCYMAKGLAGRREVTSLSPSKVGEDDCGCADGDVSAICVSSYTMAIASRSLDAAPGEYAGEVGPSSPGEVGAYTGDFGMYAGEVGFTLPGDMGA